MIDSTVNSFSLLLRISRIYREFAGKQFYLFTFLTLLESVLKGLGILMVLPLLELTAGQTMGSNFISNQLARWPFLSGVSTDLSKVLGTVVVIFIGIGVLQYFLGLVTSKISLQLRKKIQLELVEGIYQADYLFMSGKQCGEINNMVLYETTAFLTALQQFSEMVGLIINILVMVSFSFMLSWKMMLFSFAFSFPFFVSFKMANRHLFKNSAELTDNNNKLNHFIFQFIYNLKYVKVLGSVGLNLFRLIEKKFSEQLTLAMTQKKVQLLNKSIVEPCAVCFICGTIYFMVVIKGESLAQVLAAIYFLHRTTMKILAYPNGIQKIVSRMGPINAVEELREQLRTHRVPCSNLQLIDHMDQGISFSDVSFSYGNQLILENINLYIPKGKTIGIVGQSGAGKTTILDLIIGILSQQKGSIQIDGISYEKIDKSRMQKIFGYVTQDPVIFNDTIANNILLWEGNHHDSEVKERILNALRMADGLEFVKNCSDGLDTVLGEKGVKLSGGQKQRIAIARELYRNPQIMIFDEATSSLDAFSEKFIQESISRVSKSKTVVIISHRLSTLRGCDYIYLINERKIEEEGTWSDLMTRKESLFYQLCKTQEIPLTH